MERFSVCAWFLLAGALIAAQTTKPPVVVVPDFDAPPETIEAMWDGAPVILRIEIQQSHVRVAPRPAFASDPPLISTNHVARVLEVFKDDGSVGQRRAIQVGQPGGTADVDGQEITTSSRDFPLFLLGQEVVAFLEHTGTAGNFRVAYGPPGAYVFDGEDVAIPRAVRKHDFAGGKAKIKKAEFLQQLRQLKSTRQ